MFAQQATSNKVTVRQMRVMFRNCHHCMGSTRQCYNASECNAGDAIDGGGRST